MPQTLLHCIYLVCQTDLTLGLHVAVRADRCRFSEDPGQELHSEPGGGLGQVA